MTLKDLRNGWEKGHEVVLTIPVIVGEFKKLFVVLGKKGKFSLHRYMRIGDMWDISVDHKDGYLDDCLALINDDKDLNDLYKKL